MHFILVIMIFNVHSSSVAMTEFNNEPACLSAAKVSSDESLQYRYERDIRAFCVRKGE